ncbi:MAG: OmpA family protein, partial [Sphingopyxis sp.]|uniref:OmpA family protein n=1 Tax=Sphingopyxis sp. TaxID=1908224 RepID=UPI001A188C48
DAAGTATATAIPEGAGVVAADREGKPMLTVYFDTGKSEVSNDLTTAASSVKAYLDSNAAATLAVSGYNDPTGNAAANAELSKNRAQSVKAALEKLGIAAERVVLEKPAETTTTGTENSAARRVEVTVKG